MGATKAMMTHAVAKNLRCPVASWYGKNNCLQNFSISENLFVVKNVLSKNTKSVVKNISFWRNLETKLKFWTAPQIQWVSRWHCALYKLNLLTYLLAYFWALVISFVGNSQLSVKKLLVPVPSLYFLTYNVAGAGRLILYTLCPVKKTDPLDIVQ